MFRRLLVLSLIWLASGQPARAADPFELVNVPVDGRAVMAEVLDVDGDGRSDLVWVEFDGVPPDDRRHVHVHVKGADGRIPSAPSFSMPLIADAAAYDVADVTEAPGTELLLLHARGVTALNLARPDAPRREYTPSAGVSVGATRDERGLDRLRLAWPELGEARLVVPMFGEVWVYEGDGTQRARLHVGGRANYLIVPRPGPLIAESDLQLFYDAPRLSAGDVNGDGRPDLVSATRHEILVFLGDEAGGFPIEPDRKLFPGLVDEPDHIRGSGTVRVDAVDLNADGRLDLVISHLAGGILDARGRTTVHLNRDGAWALDAPDSAFERERGWGMDDIVDLDQDGRPELIRIGVPFSILELAETLIQRELDVEVSVHRSDPGKGFAKAEWFSLKVDTPLSFEAGGRPLGFVSNVRSDVNNDGWNDLLTAGGGKQLEVFLGSERGGYGRRASRQSFDTEGRISFGDLDDDGLTDFVVYDPRRADVPIKLGRNLGLLPNTRRTPTMGPSEVGAERKPDAGEGSVELQPE